MRCNQPRIAKPAAAAANQRFTRQSNFFRSTISARAPAGSVNKKKGSEATVERTEIKNGDGVSIFIIQVAAVSCAATQVPEMTAAIHSFRKTGFAKAAQVEKIRRWSSMGVDDQRILFTDELLLTFHFRTFRSYQ